MKKLKAFSIFVWFLILLSSLFYREFAIYIFSFSVISAILFLWYNRDKGKYTIMFNSPNVIDAVNKMSKEEKKKFHSDIIKSQTENLGIELNINGKVVRFVKKLKQ